VPGYAPVLMFKPQNPRAAALLREIRSRHPGFREAVLADARVALRHQAEPEELRSGLEAVIQLVGLIWTTDAFLAQMLYRLKARLQRARVPVLPRIAHRLAIATGQVAIGDPVVVHPGLYLLHGQVVIDGLVEIQPGAVIGPFVTIGLRSGDIAGPTVERDVTIGTGAKVLGRVTVGADASVGANSVVVDDVPPGATVVGVPGRARTD
jgi:serine O-acetyltransferase